MSAWTVRAWLSGARSPSPTSQRRINALATRLDLPLPYPQWATGVRQRDGTTPARRASQVETDSGFSVVEKPSGVRVVLRLRPGLYAVKMRGDDGGTEYAICDGDMHPIYPPAKTLEELRQRFPDAG